MMVSVSGSISVPITPVQGLRPNCYGSAPARCMDSHIERVEGSVIANGNFVRSVEASMLLMRECTRAGEALFANASRRPFISVANSIKGQCFAEGITLNLSFVKCASSRWLRCLAFSRVFDIFGLLRFQSIGSTKKSSAITEFFFLRLGYKNSIRFRK